MKIGAHLSAAKSNGGLYQYSVTFIEALLQMPEHQVTLFNASPDLPPHIAQSGCKVVSLGGNIESSATTVSGTQASQQNPLLSRLKQAVLDHAGARLRPYVFDLNEKRKARLVEQSHLDFLLFPGAAELSYLTRIPSIVAIHDLQHRLNPQFPEVSSNGQWQKREHIYQRITKRAYHLIAESEVGKEDIVNLYGMDPERITILPYLPPDYLHPDMTRETAQTLLTEFKLPEQFFFYPAQFWPHKNHENLVRALGILHQTHPDASLVLVGSDKRPWNILERIRELSRTLGIENRMLYLGYVTNEQMSALYRLATAMIMPTFLGPSNIPPLEAWQMGCPLIYSNVRGCREQAGDAALLANPAEPEDLALQMSRILESPDLRTTLIAKGHERIAQWTTPQFIATIQSILTQAYDTARHGRRTDHSRE